MPDQTRERRSPAIARRGRPAAAGPSPLADRLNASAAATRLGAIADGLDAAVQRRADRTGLPDALKAGVERLSGLSMDDVRVHRNSPAPAQLEAHAFAQGSDIHLGPGQEQHLPHEAWHVVQQKQGRVVPTGQLGGVPLNDDTGLEREADAMGTRAAQLKATASPLRAVTAQRRVAQRKPTKVNVRPDTAKMLPGTISGVSFGSRPSSNSTIQGQHLTAYVALQAMISSHVIDRTPRDACFALRTLVQPIRDLINPNTTKTHLFGWLDQVDEYLTDAVIHYSAHEPKTGMGFLVKAIDLLLKVRNQVPGTAMATTNTGGHGESDPAGKLKVMENYLRRNDGTPDPSWGTANAAAREAGGYMWNLLDGAPVKGKAPAALAQVMVKHMKQMQLSYPETFAWLSTNPAWYLRPLLTSGAPGMPLAPLAAGDRQAVVDEVANLGW